MKQSDVPQNWIILVAGVCVLILAIAFGSFVGGWECVAAVGLLGILALLVLTAWKIRWPKSIRHFWLNWLLVSGWVGVVFVALSFSASWLGSRLATRDIIHDFGAAVITGGLGVGGTILSAILVKLVVSRYSKRAQSD